MPAYLVFDDDNDAQSDAEASLAALDSEYGCPYTDGNYIFNTWCAVTNSETNEEEWGFYKPEERLGKTQTELDACLVGDYTEVSEMPSDWVI